VDGTDLYLCLIWFCELAHPCLCAQEQLNKKQAWQQQLQEGDKAVWRGKPVRVAAAAAGGSISLARAGWTYEGVSASEVEPAEHEQHLVALRSCVRWSVVIFFECDEGQQEGLRALFAGKPPVERKRQLSE
jgi:hypothetical protein